MAKIEDYEHIIRPIALVFHFFERIYGRFLNSFYVLRCFLLHSIGLCSKPNGDQFQARIGYHPGVFITGTTAGIGKSTALKFANSGWTVFATYRNLKSGQELLREFESNFAGSDEMKGEIVLIELDVEKSGDIERAYQAVVRESEKRGVSLMAVVNNAGFCTIAGFEVTSQTDIDRQFRLIFYSFIDVCKTFLPLIKKNRGRFIFLNSVGSYTVVPGFGIYCAAKGAMRNLTFALRMEFSRFGVGVSSIEPGFITTEGIYDGTVNAFDEFFKNPNATGITSLGLITTADTPNSTSTDENYLKETIKDARELVANDWNKVMRLQRIIGTPQENVALNIFDAVTSSYMKSSYIVGWDARTLSFIESFMPEDFIEWTLFKIFPYCNPQY